VRILAIFIVFCALGILAPVAAATAPKSSVAIGKSTYGPVLFDGRGFVLYAFTHDRAGRSTCSGACARAWPPYLARGTVRAGAGARQSLIATVRRADGSRQVTYAGRPLYYYAGDRKPGQILCQDVSEFGGLWLIVRASGAPVR
jgi:predicted lipoprotein with Yx(FWY)xxD motif